MAGETSPRMCSRARSNSISKQPSDTQTVLRDGLLSIMAGTSSITLTGTNSVSSVGASAMRPGKDIDP